MSQTSPTRPLVLLADDDPQLSRLLVAVLRENDYDVIHAANGQEALAAIAERKPDLAILDIVMPVLGGIETAKTLREAPETQDIPIIALSATAAPAQTSENGQALWSVRMEKPAKIRELLATIASLTGRSETELKVNWSRLTTELWSDKYAVNARDKVAGGLVQVEALETGPGSGKELETLRTIAHQLAGSAATFGYQRVASVAREVETKVAGWRDADCSLAENEIDYLRSSLGEILDLLSDDATAEPGSTVSQQQPVHSDSRDRDCERYTCLLVHDDAEYTGDATRLARKRDLRFESFDSIDTALARLECGVGDMIVLGGVRATADDFAWVRKVRAASECVPIYVLSREDSTDRRVAAIRAGADRFLFSTHEPSRLVEACAGYFQSRRPDNGRVLVVDDDEAVLDIVEPSLVANGFEVFRLDDPTVLFEKLTAVNPDVLITDIDMPGANGIELTRALRASERWGQLPILVMSRHTDFEHRKTAYEAGIDDFITKPLVTDELVMRVAARLERETAKRTAMERDPITGLYNRHAFLSRAAVTLEQLRSESRSMAMAVVELEHLTTFIQAHGLEAGDEATRALAESLEAIFNLTVHTVGRVSGSVFVAMQYDTTVEEMAARLEVGLRQLEEDKRLVPDGRVPDILAVTAAVIGCNADAAVPDLINHAVASRRKRRRVTVSRVVNTELSRALKVYVVDDDTMLCEMLGYALTRAGFDCETFNAGDDALEALLNKPVSAERPVVLLDVDLPRVNGLTVLRELERERPGYYQVLLVTAHGSESDQLAGLRSSAVDYVVKPIDIPLIVAKVRKLSRENELHA